MIRRFASIVLFYLIGFGAGPVLYALLFRYGALNGLQVLFFRGIALAIATAAAQAAGISFASRTAAIKRLAGVKDILLVVALAFSFNITFLIVFPVTFDRSVTMFLLYAMERYPQAEEISAGDLERQLTQDYVRGRHAVDRRMQEQILIGNVEQTGTGYRLTAHGRLFLGWSRVVGDICGLALPRPPPAGHSVASKRK